MKAILTREIRICCDYQFGWTPHKSLSSRPSITGSRRVAEVTGGEGWKEYRYAWE